MILEVFSNLNDSMILISTTQERGRKAAKLNTDQQKKQTATMYSYLVLACIQLPDRHLLKTYASTAIRRITESFRLEDTHRDRVQV